MSKETIRVLIIEDEPIAQKVLKGMLENRGCATDIASNCKEALRFSEFCYQLIFIDCGLPKMEGIDMDGYELAKQIRQRENEKGITPRPIVMLSAYPREEDTEERCDQAGINAYYIKPLSLNSLDEILHKYVILRFAATNH